MGRDKKTGRIDLDNSTSFGFEIKYIGEEELFIWHNYYCAISRK